MLKKITFIEPRGNTIINVDPDTDEHFMVAKDKRLVPICYAGPEVSATITIILQRHIKALPSQWVEATVLRKSTSLGATIVTVFVTGAGNVYLVPFGLTTPIAVKGTYQQVIDQL